MWDLSPALSRSPSVLILSSRMVESVRLVLKTPGKMTGVRLSANRKHPVRIPVPVVYWQ